MFHYFTLLLKYSRTSLLLFVFILHHTIQGAASHFDYFFLLIILLFITTTDAADRTCDHTSEFFRIEMKITMNLMIKEYLQIPKNLRTH